VFIFGAYICNVNISKVSYLDVDILMVCHLDVDILTVGHLDILTVSHLYADKAT
jgi:hypothetical protein